LDVIARGVVQQPSPGLDQFIQLTVGESRVFLISAELIPLPHRDNANIGNIRAVLGARLVLELPRLKRVARKIPLVVQHRFRHIADLGDLVARFLIFEIRAVGVSHGHDPRRGVFRGYCAHFRFPGQRILTR